MVAEVSLNLLPDKLCDIEASLLQRECDISLLKGTRLTMCPNRAPPAVCFWPTVTAEITVFQYRFCGNNNST